MASRSAPVLVSLVTGSNRGIGTEVARQLGRRYASRNAVQHQQQQQVQQVKHVVLVCSRSPAQGREVADALQAELDENEQRVSFDSVELDVNSVASVSAMVDLLLEKYGERSVDLLVNNAGIAWKGDAFDIEVATQTLGCNYFGSKRVMEALIKPALFADDARVIQVSSGAGALSKLKSQTLRDAFLSPALDLEHLDQLMHDFIEDVRLDRYAERGWPRQAYAVSKMGATALATVFSRCEALTKRGISVHAVCPGWCSTDMGGSNASRSSEQGATSVVMCLDVPKDQAGCLWRDGEKLDPVQG